MTNKINFKSLKKNTIRYSLVSFSLLAIIVLLISVSAYKATEEETGVSSESLVEKTKKQTISVTREWAKYKVKKADEADLKSVLESRKKLLDELFEKENSSLILGLALPEDIITSVPQSLKGFVEERVSNISGTLSYLHGHNFSESGEILDSNNEFYLDKKTTGDYSYRIYPTDLGFEGPVLHGDRINVKSGIKLGKNIAAHTNNIKVISASSSRSALSTSHDHSTHERVVTINKPNSETLVSAATTERTAVVILFNFSNNTTQPYTPDQIRSVMFTGTSSVDEYYEETSFNSLGFAPGGSGVTDWVTINQTNLSCDVDKWASEADSKAKSAGFNTSASHKIYFFPRSSSCDFGGLATIGGGTVWMNGSNSLRIFAHELGHNLKLHHASSDKCTFNGLPSTFSTAGCVRSEYGDIYNVMGSSSNQIHGYHKAIVNFISSTNIKDVTSGGEFDIYPINTKQSGAQVLRIRRDNTGSKTDFHIYLEYRRPTKYDNFATTSSAVNGVMIRLAPTTATNWISTLLDAVPETTSFSDATLVVGKTVKDPKTGIAISTLSADTEKARVKIEFGQPDCNRVGPTLSVTPTQTWNNAGTTTTYTATLTSNDTATCTAASYGLKSPNLPTGFSFGPTVPTFELLPGQSMSKTFDITTAETTASGIYGISIQGYNVDIPSITSNNPAFIYHNISATDIVAPIVSIGSPQDGATINGRVVINASASDDSGIIAKIELYIDSKLVKSYSGVSSISYTGDLAGKGRSASYGTKQIKVIAYDNSGGVGEKTITVNVVK